MVKELILLSEGRFEHMQRKLNEFEGTKFDDKNDAKNVIQSKNDCIPLTIHTNKNTPRGSTLTDQEKTVDEQKMAPSPAENKHIHHDSSLLCKKASV